MDICATFPCYNARLIKENIFSIGLPDILVIPHNVEAENFNWRHKLPRKKPKIF